MKEYPPEVIRKAEEICTRIRVGEILTGIHQGSRYPQKALARAAGQLLKEFFPDLTEQQIGELYSYAMHPQSE